MSFPDPSRPNHRHRASSYNTHLNVPSAGERRGSTSSGSGSRPPSADGETYDISPAALAALDASAVFTFEGMVRQTRRAARNGRDGESSGLLMLKGVSVSIAPPAHHDEKGPLCPLYLSILPPLDPSTVPGSSSGPPINWQLHRASLIHDDILSIDGVSGILDDYSQPSTPLGRIVQDLTSRGTEHLNLFCAELLLRPVYARRSDGEFEVRLAFDAGAFQSMNAICGVADLARL
ncbi:hypothetical protein JCM10213_008725 [Rhodosporidiobolus nylandii]